MDSISIVCHCCPSAALSTSVALGAVSGAIFGLVAFLPDLDGKGWRVVVATCAVMVAVTVGISAPGALDARRDRRERRQLLKAHAAYLVYANRANAAWGSDQQVKVYL